MSEEPLSTTEQETKSLEGPALKEALQRQLEWYFSSKNLSADFYLTNKMNAEKYVPVVFIAEFPKVKALTEDQVLLVEVMRNCKNMELDAKAENVRPRAKKKPQRKSIILRDIKEATVDEIKGIFNNDSCGTVVSVKKEVGNTWYVTFETQDQCIDTAQYINFGSVDFKGQQLRCAVKSELAPRSPGFNPYTGPMVPPGASGDAGQGFQRPQMGYFNPYRYPAYMGYPPRWQQQQRGFQPGGQGTPEFYQGGRRGGRTQASRGRKKGNVGTPPGAKRKAKQPRKPKGEGLGVAGKRAATPPKELAPGDFPALPNNRKPGSAGYTGPFRLYEREEIAAVVHALADKGFPRPASFPKKCPVLQQAPLTRSLLLDPFPVIYPASPSPELAAQPTHSGPMPLLDLGAMMGDMGPEPSTAETSTPIQPAPTQTVPKQKQMPQSQSGKKKQEAKQKLTEAAREKWSEQVKQKVAEQSKTKAGKPAHKIRRNSKAFKPRGNSKGAPEGAKNGIQETKGSGAGLKQVSAAKQSKNAPKQQAAKPKTNTSKSTRRGLSKEVQGGAQDSAPQTTAPQTAAPSKAEKKQAPPAAKAAPAKGGWGAAGGKASLAEVVKAAEATAQERAAKEAEAASKLAAEKKNNDKKRIPPRSKKQYTKGSRRTQRGIKKLSKPDTDKEKRESRKEVRKELRKQKDSTDAEPKPVKTGGSGGSKPTWAAMAARLQNASSPTSPGSQATPTTAAATTTAATASA